MQNEQTDLILFISFVPNNCFSNTLQGRERELSYKVNKHIIMIFDGDEREPHRTGSKMTIV